MLNYVIKMCWSVTQYTWPYCCCSVSSSLAWVSYLYCLFAVSVNTKFSSMPGEHSLSSKKIGDIILALFRDITITHTLYVDLVRMSPTEYVHADLIHDRNTVM